MNEKLKQIDQEIKRLEGLEKSLAAGFVGFGQGFTYGGADEAAADTGAKMRGTSFEDELAMQERIRAGAAEQNPAAYTTGQIAGAVFSPINKVLGAAGNAVKYGGKVTKGLTSAVAGGALGGFLSGQGSAEDRLDDTAEGATLAGAADLALRGSGKVIKDVGKQVGTTLGLRNVQKVANEKLANAVGSVDEAKAALADERNLPLNINRQTEKLAEDVISRPSPNQSAARQVVETQRQGAKDVALDALSSNMDDIGRYGEEVAGIKQRLQDIGEQQYQKIVRPDVRVKKDAIIRRDQFGVRTNTPQANAIFEDATVQQAIKRVEADPALGFNPAERDSLPYLHKLQSIIGQEAQGLRGALEPALRDKARAQGLETARRKVIGAIEEIEPKYAAARKDFADASELENAMQSGREFMRGEADEVITEFKDLPKQAQDLFRLSAAKELGIKIEKQGFATTANKIMAGGDKDLQRRLKAIFPDEKSFSQFVDRVKAEKPRFDTATRVLNANRAQGQQGDVLDTALTASNNGVSGVLRNVLGGVRLPEKYTSQLAEDLTQSTAAGKQELIDRLLKERAARAAAKQSSLRRGAAIGGIVGQEPNRRN